MLELLEEVLERRRAGIPYSLPDGCPTKGGESWGVAADATLDMPSRSCHYPAHEG